jgi:hypothetical protein
MFANIIGEQQVGQGDRFSSRRMCQNSRHRFMKVLLFSTKRLTWPVQRVFWWQFGRFISCDWKGIEMRGSAFCIAALFCAFMPTTCFSSIEYNQTVTNAVIYGGGNSNGGFAIEENQFVEVGLRAHLRYPLPSDSTSGIMHQGSGVYGSFEAQGYTSGGVAGGLRGSWNFDWSINSDTDDGSAKVNAYTYLLEIDYDPSQGTDFLSFNPLDVSYADHSFGDNSTGNNGGVEAPDGDTATYSQYLGQYNLVQNSWNLAFFTGPQAFDPTADATYTIRLSAFNDVGLLAMSSIDVIVGAGGAAVPEPWSFLTWGGLVGCAVFAARRNQRA